MAIFSVLLFACNDDIVSEQNSFISEELSQKPILLDSTLGFVVKIHDNTLCFDSAKDVIKALDVLRKLPANERRIWENSVGFTSAQTLLEDLKLNIEGLNNKDELKSLIQENKELVIESPENSYGIKSRIYGSYPFITGKDGFFVSESVWCKVFDGKLYSTMNFDREGYLLMRDLNENVDLSGTNVQAITVDFNWENNQLKSYHYDEDVTDTKIVLYQYNYAVNNPTKRSKFTIELINNYATRTVSDQFQIKKYYLDVFYNGYCDYCNPLSYSITYAGNVYYFTKVQDKHYRIQLPYSTYLFDYPFVNPNWDNEAVWYETSTCTWYTYWGNIRLACSFRAEKRNMLQNWVDYDNTIVWFSDVTADIELGKDLYYRSSALDLDGGPYDGNYVEKFETGVATGGGAVYSLPISLYQTDPPAKFKGCVSGILYSRFCPENYNFSFNF